VTAAVLATVLSMVLAAPADTQQAPASAELRRVIGRVEILR
jgi:hypothetical protein